MLIGSVADRVKNRFPRPTYCDCCGSHNVHLQKRSLMGLPTQNKWDLVWHCGNCNALVGCHHGTDIPLGRLADRETRRARYELHRAFDPLWKKHGWRREAAYAWLARTLNLSEAEAHIGLLDVDACRKAHLALLTVKTDLAPRKRHWSQDKRKRRNK